MIFILLTSCRNCGSRSNNYLQRVDKASNPGSCGGATPSSDHVPASHLLWINLHLTISVHRLDNRS